MHWQARTIKTLIYLAILNTLLAPLAGAEEKLPLKVIKLTERVLMLQGRGGNLGVSVGDDGLFLIDDQYAPATAEILTQLKHLHPGKLGFVINTHWHGDHTGGNENIAKTGARIVAHDNVRTRMSHEQFIELFRRKVPASPDSALPVITFDENITFHLNDDELAITHLPNAHTDGDAMVHFKQANIIHLGDIYFNGVFPFIDTSSGGSIDGMIRAVNYALTLANEQTQIIPGHGQLSNSIELETYRDMLVTAQQKMTELMKQGKSLEQIQAEKPLEELGKQWGNGFIKTDIFTKILFVSLSQ